MKIYIVDQESLFRAQVQNAERFPYINTERVFCMTKAQFDAEAADGEEVHDDYEVLEDALYAAESLDTPEAIEVRTACRKALGYYEEACVLERAVRLYGDGYRNRPVLIAKLKKEELLTDEEAAPLAALFDKFSAQDNMVHKPSTLYEENPIEELSRKWAELPEGLQCAAESLDQQLAEDLSDGDAVFLDLLDRGLDPKEFQNIAACRFRRYGCEFFDGTFTQKQIESAAMIHCLLEDLKVMEDQS